MARRGRSRPQRRAPARTRKPARRAGAPRRARKRGRRRADASRPGFWRFFADASVLVFVAAIGLAGLVFYYARDLPDTDGLWRNTAGPGQVLVAANGEPIAVRGEMIGAPVRLADLPPHVPQAVLAVEDRNFYHHVGVNPFSVIRAVIVNASEGEVRQGGSTLSQQLAKNLFLSADRTFKRKMQELLLAFWLEQRFTKDEILTLYLNRVYFGAGAYGVDSAARRYFGKPATALEIGEAAILAGLLKAPSRYAPTSDPDSAGRRARIVIEAMEDAGFITSAEAAAAFRAPVRLRADRFAVAPYFVDHALSSARTLVSGADASLVIRTTFDAEAQAALEAGVRAAFARHLNVSDIQVAAVLLDADGGVKAMVGGRDYAQSQFNRATQARRQPGSAFKPFIFLAALEGGAALSDFVLDEEIDISGWRPSNYKDRFYGEVTLREALARSLNSAALRLQESTGRNAVRLAARRMGLEAELSRTPSLGLGVDVVTPIMLAQAYVPFVNGGYRVRAHAIRRIETSEGDLLYANPGGIEAQAASAGVIEEMNEGLSAVAEWGTGRAAAIDGLVVAGKTGTTQDHRDAWFAGHAAGMALVVWVGRDDNAPMDGVTGGTLPAEIWREIMIRVANAESPLSAAIR